MTELKTYTHGPAEGDKPEQIVVMLHGLGADGQDLIGLAPHLAQDLPKALFIAPDAPQACDMAPMGYQWFSLKEWTPESILAGVKDAAPTLEAFLQGLLDKYELSADKLVLLGFSQGTMMSLYVAPRFKDKIAGVLGYSGALIWDADADVDDLKKVPVCLVHGEADSVVPFDAYTHARETLQTIGFDVSGCSIAGLDHGIDMAGIEEGKAFLKQAFG